MLVILTVFFYCYCAGNKVPGYLLAALVVSTSNKWRGTEIPDSDGAHNTFGNTPQPDSVP